jgi:hypothetical protein
VRPTGSLPLPGVVARPAADGMLSGVYVTMYTRPGELGAALYNQVVYGFGPADLGHVRSELVDKHPRGYLVMGHRLDQNVCHCHDRRRPPLPAIPTQSLFVQRHGWPDGYGEGSGPWDGPEGEAYAWLYVIGDRALHVHNARTGKSKDIPWGGGSVPWSKVTARLARVGEVR